MIKIFVTSPDVKELQGVSKVSGKPYHMRIQTCHAFPVDSDGQVAEFPDKFEIALEKDQTPYLRGVYTLAPSSVYVSRDGKLEVRPRLLVVEKK